jgi:preprotein translocase SecE subunit
MATAVQTANQPNTSPPAKTGSNLLIASIIGAAFILTGVVVAGFAVPKLLGGVNLGNSFTAAFVRILAQIVVISAWAYAGGWLAGDNPPKGLRGGIFLVISVVIAWFFLTRAVGLNFGTIAAGVVGAALAFGGVRLLTSKTGTKTMITIEEQGWLHTTQYKRTQGRRLRQYTIGGLLLIGLSGVYSLIHHQAIGQGDLVFNMPFELPSFTALTDKQFAVPLLLALAVGWLAWRLVNIPMFSDFLIATEAEMNKVAWSTRKKLVQDTIVVLVTTVLLTVFLLVIDLFWGWLLSTEWVSVIPKPKTDGKAKDPTQQVDW